MIYCPTPITKPFSHLSEVASPSQQVQITSPIFSSCENFAKCPAFSELDLIVPSNTSDTFYLTVFSLILLELIF